MYEHTQEGAHVRARQAHWSAWRVPMYEHGKHIGTQEGAHVRVRQAHWSAWRVPMYEHGKHIGQHGGRHNGAMMCSDAYGPV